MIKFKSFNEIDTEDGINKVKKIALNISICFIVSLFTICFITPKIIDRHMVNKYVETSMMENAVKKSMQDDVIDEHIIAKLKHKYFIMRRQ